MNGQKHGLRTEWWESGMKNMEDMWRDGKQHGLDRWWDNGQKGWEGMYRAGEKHGVGTYLDTKGGKQSEVYYFRSQVYARIDRDNEGNVSETYFPKRTSTPLTVKSTSKSKKSYQK